MAIREVLTSFTFEQQRQMINLIGTDVGDASTLLTPTNVLVSGINEIVNGDVDLVNQTHGMDAGSLASPSLYWDAGQGFYKVDANKIGLSTGLAIAGDLEVDGDITFRAGGGSGGTLTFGDLNTDNIVFNAELTSSIVPDSTANYNLGSATKQWNNLWVDGTASIDTLTVDENSTFTGYLQVDSGDVRVPSTQTTVDLFDDYATTVEAFGAGTAIRLGATTGTLTLRNPTIVGSETTQNLFNTVATTVNAFGAATNINMGVAGGGGNTNFNILSDDVVCSGDLNVNGGELLSSSNTVDVFINNTVNIGNSTTSGLTTINNELRLKFDLSFVNASGNNAIYIPDNEQNSLRIREGSNDYMQFRTDNGNERVVVWKDLYVVGNLDVSGTTTTIDATNLVVEDKNIELGASAAPSDTTADGGGITLKGTTDKTITYNNTSGNWETNIGLKVTGTLTATTGGSFDNEVYINGSDASTQRYLNFNRPTAGEYRATLRRDAWYLGETVQNIGDVTPTGANITLKMNGDAIFAGTVTDSMGPLRRLGIDPASTSFTLTTSYPGQLIRMSGSGQTITVPQNVLSAGDMISIFNVSSGDMTVAQGTGVTLYNAADGTTGNRTLAAKGICTIVCTASNEFVISGTQLS
jgi:hypothetical protein|tara:strand:- start:1469 stop:3382 length:1914 start_codon:yes stop_codon:yes gene_type:complete